jgi:hypothetical protein
VSKDPQTIKQLQEGYTYTCKDGREIKFRRLSQRERENLTLEGNDEYPEGFVLGELSAPLFELMFNASTFDTWEILYRQVSYLCKVLCGFEDAAYVREHFLSAKYRQELIALATQILQEEGALPKGDAEGIPADPKAVTEMVEAKETKKVEKLGNSSEPTTRRRTTSRSSLQVEGSSTTPAEPESESPETADTATAA